MKINRQLKRKKIIYSDFIMQKHPNKIPLYERVLFFDPTAMYKRVEGLLDKKERHPGLSVEQLFPKQDGVCACGCGLKPESGKDWQRKFATAQCSLMVGDIVSIVNNYFGRAQYYISLYYGHKCSE